MLVSKSSSPSKKGTSRLIRTIAVFKLLKAVLLICLGFGAFRLLNPVVGQRLTHWVGSFTWNYTRDFILSGLSKIIGLKPTQLEALGIGAFLYAILFMIEGIGLWFEKRWAEYLTVIATGSFLPFELYEIYIRATYSRGLTLLFNLLVFIYLIRVVRRRAA
ncbi:MAG: DUF2127 domain-containing protein [Ignavibacteriales bacterium]|nr:DUF2127 domain-containing protein [Ignavibacteriales bacterium]